MKMDEIEIRTKALELTLKMLSIFESPEEVKKIINDLRQNGSFQHKVISIAQIFEVYIENGFKDENTASL